MYFNDMQYKLALKIQVSCDVLCCWMSGFWSY